MELLKYKDVLKRIEEIDDTIFKGIDKTKLSPLEKRKIIYNFLVNTIVYDYDYLENIKNKGPRDLIQELISVLYDFKGVCNGISQAYKLLLEYNGIYSICIITMIEYYDNGNKETMGHQLNLVYDEEKDLFSFDDATLPLLTNIDLNETFDYDLEDAKKLGEGLTNIKLMEEKWLVLPSYIVNLYVGSTSEFYKKFGYETGETLRIETLKNIKKQKNNLTTLK